VVRAGDLAPATTMLVTPALDQTPSNCVGLVVVAVFKISSKYVGIVRSLATRRTLGIPKLLKCIVVTSPVVLR